MLGLFTVKEKRVEKINLHEVSGLLARRFWQYEMVPGKDAIVVKGKYRNHQRDFHKLFVHFVGENKVQFKDEQGRLITHIPSSVEKQDLFPQLKNILNVLS